ncbi:MAG TPA: 3-phosphoshikimate 1-carboxyvinyltransferase, partial [Euzebya sp.]|nr:3-phosphoshikimate 1-carboxyvinyltransferase [Euzebya sp.]
GTTIRFGTAVAALADGRVTLTGDAPLRRRPLGPLVAALQDLGAVATDAGGFPPVTVGGGLDGGAVSIDVGGSSQFASAVLLAAPYARGDVHLSTTGASAGAYIDLTVDAMQAWGADVLAQQGLGWTVTAGVGYTAQDLVVEYDASAAAHLFGLAVATGGQVTVTNVTQTIQPDAGLLEVLARFGATISIDGPRVTVTGPERPTAAGTVDLERMPDQVTTVAALAALADGTTTIVGTEVVRGHETDRLTALATELSKVGTSVEERADGLVIDGRTTRGAASLDTYHDHRLAMAFAALGARVPDVVINDPGCVAKTFPDFWQVLVNLGGQVRTR